MSKVRNKLEASLWDILKPLNWKYEGRKLHYTQEKRNHFIGNAKEMACGSTPRWPRRRGRVSDDTKELVERLRRLIEVGPQKVGEVGLRMCQAADTIERLERDLAALAERCENMRSTINDFITKYDQLEPALNNPQWEIVAVHLEVQEPNKMVP